MFRHKCINMQICIDYREIEPKWNLRWDAEDLEKACFEEFCFIKAKDNDRELAKK